MATRPYRLTFDANPADYGRITMPKGALVSSLPGGPATAGDGQLGAPYGNMPGYVPFQGSQAPSYATTPPVGMGGGTFTPFHGQAPYVGMLNQLAKGIINLSVPATTGGMQARYVQNLRQSELQDVYGQPLQTPLAQVQPAGPLQPGQQTSQNIQATGRTEPGTTNIAQDYFSLMQSGRMPGYIGLNTALGMRNNEGIALSDILVRQGWVERDGVLYNPGGSPTSGGPPPTPQNQMVKYGAGRDKWASEKWVASWRRRKIRGMEGGGGQQNKPQDRGLHAYGLVNFNTSAG